MSKSSKIYQLESLRGSSIAEIPIVRQAGRAIWVGDEKSNSKKIDFCSTNYLDFDQRPELIERGIELTKKWGAISNWSRFEVDPKIYSDLESEIAEFLGETDITLAHTITAACFSLIPAIVGKGTVFTDEKLHAVVYEAARLARDHGAEITRFRHQGLEDLEARLKNCTRPGVKLVCVDGVYSISATLAPIRELQELCAKYDAFLWVDDAHGFGVHGKNGRGAVDELSAHYNRTFYVSSFNKAFGTHTAFSTCPKEFKETDLRSRHLQHLFSAPIAPFTVGTVFAALELNKKEGDFQRARLAELSRRFRVGAAKIGFEVETNSSHPVVFLKVGALKTFQAFSEEIFRTGIVAGIRTYPVVPEDSCGLRFALSAGHSETDIDTALNILADALQKIRNQSRPIFVEGVA